MTRLLIVSPAFHGYDESIAQAFRHLGYDVSTYRYDLARSAAEKAWNKARHELPAKLRREQSHMSAQRASRRAADAVRAARPDVVLVVRGDVLTEEFWAAAAQGGRRVAVWMYDELRHTRFDPALVAPYARLATYSDVDAAALRKAGYAALHVPLGFDNTLPATEATTGEGRVSFVGAPSARRAAALRALHDAGVPVQAWGRGWSDHPVDRARTWRWRGCGLPNGRDLPGPLTHAVMRSSAATLNVHADQAGFTMRTFEAAGVGAVQLIDRADVARFYEPGREVLVFDGPDELVELARRAVERPSDFTVLRRWARARTLGEHTLGHRARELETLWA